jgi:uncharacterized protein (DUF305 family)
MRYPRLMLAATLATAAAACGSARGAAAPDPITTNEATGAPAHHATGGADTTARGQSAADVAFLQGMIHHHAQALVMVAMIPSRTAREEMRMLGQRIAVSQRDEIASMRRWLVSRGEYAPSVDSAGVHMHGAHGAEVAPMAHDSAHHDMPGMISSEDLARLSAATGTEFDRLFLELMIRHHEGALAMVRTLFSTVGAAQESELFDIASEVDADQRAEIERMRALLRALPGGAPGR